MGARFGTADRALFAEEQGADLIHTKHAAHPRRRDRLADRAPAPRLAPAGADRGPIGRSGSGREGEALATFLMRHSELVIANSQTSADALASVLPERHLVVVPQRGRGRRLRGRGAAGAPTAGGRHGRQPDVDLEEPRPLLRDLRPVEDRAGHPAGLRARPVRGGGRVSTATTAGDCTRGIAELGLAGRVEVRRLRRRAGSHHGVDRSTRSHPPSTSLFGRVVVEAMAGGRPVVGVEAGGVGEIVEHGETGLLAPAGDAARLAEAVDRLLADPDERRRMGAAGRSRACEHYSIERHLERIRSAYEEAVRRHRGVESPASV